MTQAWALLGEPRPRLTRVEVLRRKTLALNDSAKISTPRARRMHVGPSKYTLVLVHVEGEDAPRWIAAERITEM